MSSGTGKASLATLVVHSCGPWDLPCRSSAISEFEIRSDSPIALPDASGDGKTLGIQIHDIDANVDVVSFERPMNPDPDGLYWLERGSASDTPRCEFDARLTFNLFDDGVSMADSGLPEFVLPSERVVHGENTIELWDDWQVLLVTSGPD